MAHGLQWIVHHHSRNWTSNSWPILMNIVLITLFKFTLSEKGRIVKRNFAILFVSFVLLALVIAKPVAA